jgi:WD repeat-containing protein 48
MVSEVRDCDDKRRLTFVLPPPSQQRGNNGTRPCHSGVNSLCLLSRGVAGQSASLQEEQDGEGVGPVVHENIVDVSLTSTATRVWSASRDSLVHVWDATTLSGESRTAHASYISSYEGHIDWVSDVVLVNDKVVATCSFDGTLRTWDTRDTSGGVLRQGGSGGLVDQDSASSSHHPSSSTGCFVGHSDYVTGLAVSKDSTAAVVYSCGLMGEVFAWDVSHQHMTSKMKRQSPLVCVPSLDSLYSIECCGANVVYVGSASGAMYGIDVRSGEVVWNTATSRVASHTGAVRDMVVMSDTKIVSGGSDGKILVWDLRQRVCVQSYEDVHDGSSVWCLEAGDGSVVYSAGRDGCVYKTDMDSGVSDLVVKKECPITALAVENEESGVKAKVWVGTERSSIECFADTSSSSSILHRDDTHENVNILAERVLEIPGTSSIVEISALTDKMHVLVKDSDGRVSMWDVTQGVEVQNFGVIDYKEKEREMFDPTQSALTWFRPDCSLGVVAGHLEPSSCFSCETYTKHLGYPDAPPDEKVNLSVQMLRALFHRWKVGKQGDTGEVSVFRFSEEASPAVMVSGDAWSLPWKKSCCELDGSEDVPEWVARCVLRGEYPVSKQLKMSFSLIPSKGSDLPPMNQSRLTAPRVLEVEKMLDYVVKKLRSKGVLCSKVPIFWNRKVKSEGTLDDAPAVVLTCNGMTIPSDFTLAAVRQWMWKRPEDLRIEYNLMNIEQSEASIELPKIIIPM